MGSDIKRIYVGLPENLLSRLVYVEDDYRTNVLSHLPGGRDVVVEYANGKAFWYDRIKRPAEYIRKILIYEIADGNESTFDNLKEETQLELTKQIIVAAYTRNHNDVSNAKTTSFKKVWNSDSSKITLIAALQEPDDFIITKSNGVKSTRLWISKIDKSNSGVGFDAICYEALEDHILGRMIYCRLNKAKKVKSNFYVATNRIIEKHTKFGRKVWEVQ